MMGLKPARRPQSDIDEVTHFELRVWSAKDMSQEDLEKLGLHIQAQYPFEFIGFEVIPSPLPEPLDYSRRKDNEAITGIRRLRGFPRYRRKH